MKLSDRIASIEKRQLANQKVIVGVTIIGGPYSIGKITFAHLGLSKQYIKRLDSESEYAFKDRAYDMADRYNAPYIILTSATLL
jgi:hypothetical protein